MTTTHGAVRGFERNADAYERARPGYPREAIEYLRRGLPSPDGKWCVELGAGTGKLTRSLVPWAEPILAIEPTDAMRGAFRRALPTVPVLSATAEHLPIRSASARAVVVAQAFHWFRQPAALQEIGRILAPGGTLALLWNLRDETIPWIASLGRLIDAESGSIPRARSNAWRSAFRDRPEFGPAETRSFSHAQILDPNGVVDRVLSISAIGLADDARQARIAEQVRSLLEREPATRGRSRLELVYRTDVYLYPRSGSAAAPGSS